MAFSITPLKELTMKHTVIRCKAETLPNAIVYFDPKVDALETINNCAITIPNLSTNGKDITVQVNANGNLSDIQAPCCPPEKVFVCNYTLNLRVSPADRLDTYLDVAIDISIDKCYVGISSLNPIKCTSSYRHTTSKKAFGIDDEGLKYNVRSALSKIIILMEKGATNLLWDILSIKKGDFYVETMRDNWIASNGIKAHLTVYRKTK